MVARLRGARLYIGGDEEYHPRNGASDVLLMHALEEVAEAVHLTIPDYVSVCTVLGAVVLERLP